VPIPGFQSSSGSGMPNLKDMCAALVVELSICRNCNWLLQGNDIEFAKGLDRKYGTGTADKLRALQNSTLHLGKFELKVIADHYRMKFNELNKEKGL
jgi:hypothetical protein